ncbi:MAG: lamin tail domain-containing protein, partial [Candidatus Falkowbacteria bacterium]
MIKQGGLLLRAGKTILILLFINAGFFCFEKSCLAVNAGDVVINEICWMGTSVSSADEWIELRNLTSSQINFSDTPWSIYKNNSLMLVIDSGTLEARGYFLISNNSENHIFTKGESILSITPDFINSSISLSNSSVQYKLYATADSSGSLIDTADDGIGNPIAGDNGDIKKSMERNNIPGDGTQTENWHTCSQAVNFDRGANDCGTPKAPNSDGQPEQEPESDTEEEDEEVKEEDEEENEQPEPQDQEQEEAIDQEVIKNYNLGDIVINEFVSDPTDNDVEWIELYNNTNKEIDLANWTIEEGSGAKTTLEGIIGSNNESKFFVIEKPKGNLNNKGDVIILRN